MTDPVKEASERGWIAEHRAKYLADGASAHLWDSTFAGGPGPLPTLLQPRKLLIELPHLLLLLE